MKRNPWPYAIVLYFIVFIGALFSWIVFAVRHDHELVRKDYYEQEMQFQHEMENVERAKAIDVRVTYDSTKGIVKIELPQDSVTGAIRFYRPSRAREDREFPIALQNGVQMIDVREFEAGLWKVLLSWKANGNGYRRDETVVFAPARLSSL